MCTYVTETLEIDGSAKGQAGWFKVTDASVYFDHPVHAPQAHTLNIDLRAPELGPAARVAMELSPLAARDLAHAILKIMESVPAQLIEGEEV